MGTAPFALPALEAVVNAGHDVAAVLSRPPRPAGRRLQPRPTAVHVRALDLGLAVATPPSLRGDDVVSWFRTLEADVAVVAAYGLILPRDILEAPRLGCINLHPSLLPRWRGAAPAAHAILHGDRETGLTVFRMDEGLDTGAILAQVPVPVPARATTESLEAGLASLGASRLPGLLARLEALQEQSVPQDAASATYAGKFSREDGRIDWRLGARELDRRVRAMAPRPGAFFTAPSGDVGILEAEPAPGGGAPGTLLDRTPAVACGTGALRLVKVRAAGRTAADGASWLRGARLEPGTRLA